MADETKTLVLTQPEGDRLALQHEGRGQLVHATAPERPLVHMVCWDSDQACKVELAGRVTLAGDEKSPVQAIFTHRFATPHRQVHEVGPLDHALRVQTALASPIHHALQMRTPVQLRFCNPWHVASDYQLELRLGRSTLLSVHLRGATVATPQPCPEDPCPPVVSHPHIP